MEEKLTEQEIDQKVEKLKEKILQNTIKKSKIVYGYRTEQQIAYEEKKKQKNRTRAKMQKKSRKKNR
jgi:hypothetical protein